jgi:DedD protein
MLTSRSGSQGSSSAPPVQTIEAVRRRARHRLIGAAVLVLVGVLGFPLLFDTEPRPVAGDIPIEIPSRSDTTVVAKAEPPIETTTETAAPKPDVAAPAEVAAPLPAKESLDSREEVIEPATAGKDLGKDAVKEKAIEQAKAKEQAKAIDQAKAKEVQMAAAAKAKNDAAESARARALLESKAPVGAERLVVQVGAFADPVSARATRLKVERAGMTTYTHVADTPSGKLIRVRVGPFASRADAEKAAAKVKALGLPARILTL